MCKLLGHHVATVHNSVNENNPNNGSNKSLKNLKKARINSA